MSVYIYLVPAQVACLQTPVIANVRITYTFFAIISHVLVYEMSVMKAGLVNII